MARKKKVTSSKKENTERPASDYYCLATRFDRSVNFFDENPDLMYFNPYRELIESEGFDKAGIIMDAIWMAYDPKSSANNSGERKMEDVKNEIAHYFLRDDKFDWDKYSHIVEAYNLDCTTKFEKRLEYWYSQIESKEEYIKTLPWATNAELKDSLLKSNKQLFKDYLEVESLVNKERKEKRLRAGIHKSRVERIPPTKD